MPKKAKAMILYEDRKLGLFTVLSRLLITNEATMPSIPP